MPVTNSAIAEELNKIGVHKASLRIFLDRIEIKPLKLFNVRTPAANILKQELLGAGADCAINENCVTGKVDHTDVLLLGSVKNYAELLRKLEPMSFFGLPHIAEQIKQYLEQLKPKTVLADGRIIDYAHLQVMGIINLTKDSFFAGSRRTGTEEAVHVAGEMLADGADILDIGAESTRSGAIPASEQDELKKITASVGAIKNAYPQCIISVDTYRPNIMRAAIDCGADIINDITGASNPEMTALTLEKNVPIIIMHMQGNPQNMQENPCYNDVVKEVLQFFSERIETLKQKGIGKDKIIIDPGIGFGKTLEHNLELIRRIKEFSAMGIPYLLAASRKTCIGETLGGLPPEERLEGTIALSCHAVSAGAQMVRVHDVKENVRAIRMMEAVR